MEEQTGVPCDQGCKDLIASGVDQATAKFNQSQNRVEIQPVTIPFSSFVSTIFTQMGGNAGPEFVPGRAFLRG